MMKKFAVEYTTHFMDPVAAFVGDSDPIENIHTLEIMVQDSTLSFSQLQKIMKDCVFSLAKINEHSSQAVITKIDLHMSDTGTLTLSELFALKSQKIKELRKRGFIEDDAEARFVDSVLSSTKFLLSKKDQDLFCDMLTSYER